MKQNGLFTFAAVAAVWCLVILPGCSGLRARATRGGSAPIATAAAAVDPWASVAPRLGSGEGVTLPPDTALPVRKGR